MSGWTASPAVEWLERGYDDDLALYSLVSCYEARGDAPARVVRIETRGPRAVAAPRGSATVQPIVQVKDDGGRAPEPYRYFAADSWARMWIRLGWPVAMADFEAAVKWRHP